MTRLAVDNKASSQKQVSSTKVDENVELEEPSFTITIKLPGGAKAVQFPVRISKPI
jgi:hypothetical protein